MAESGPPGARRSRSFGPTVLAGLGGAALAAVAAAQTWATSTGTSGAGAEVRGAADGSQSAPLGIALALVALAAWGVVLVLRGRARRVVAAIGALASAGVLATVLSTLGRVQDDAVAAAVARGATQDTFSASVTGWFVACGVGAALSLVAFVVAVRTAPGWPAMSSRYDAPAGRPDARGRRGAGGASATEEDLWRALDDGRDPTA